jgi:hypothetical protein
MGKLAYAEPLQRNGGEGMKPQAAFQSTAKGR